MKGKLSLWPNLLLAVVIILSLGLAPSQAVEGEYSPEQLSNEFADKEADLDSLSWGTETLSSAATSLATPLAVPGDGKWDRRFFNPGTNGRVQAMAVSGSDLYVGGEFTQVGAMGAIRIAKWDSLSQTWSTLGTGTNNDVFAIAANGPNIFVGGAFTEVDGQQNINHIAMWDGKSWSALGSGLGNDVYTIAVSGSKVYAGGPFTTAGGVPANRANRIAVWNTITHTWSPLGCGVRAPSDGYVASIVEKDGVLYVGGAFTQVGNWNSAERKCEWVTANRIATWDGSKWNTLSSGLNGSVRAIAVQDGTVYAGGLFTKSGDLMTDLNRIARWDGSQWHALDSGLNNWVRAIALNGGDLYAGGVFTAASGITVNGIARWDGSQWHALGSGVIIPEVWTMAVIGTDVYVGGNFGTADEGLVNKIARWDGNRWFGLGAGLGGIYVAGSSYVEVIMQDGSNIYAGGNFIRAGGTTVSGIARWDGRDWWPLGSGFNHIVQAIAVRDGTVYAGGLFTQSGDAMTDLNRIARWDGNQWHALGSGLNAPVNAIAVNENDIYVGGDFTDAGGVPAADRIARWDGNQWHALGSGLNGSVNAITIHGTDVYVGGSFTYAGGIPEADRIAGWNGSSWSPLGIGIPSGAVHAIAALDNEIYVGGDFTDAGGIPEADRIARWDGSTWSPLGSGTNERVFALATTDTDVYVGGLFTMAGGNTSLRFGRYTTMNTAPVLSYPSPVSVRPGGSRTVNPAQGPSDDGAVASIELHSVSPGFSGVITVDNTSGVVSIEVAGPIGSFTVTIRAADDEGLFTDASFTLNVTDLGACTPQTKLIASDGLAGDQFGSAVAIDGDTLIVGAPFDDDNGLVNRGAVYVYVRQGGNWILQQKLTASDALANDYFGFSVGLSGTNLIASAPGAYSAEVPSAHPGKAYIFVRDGESWSQQAKLEADDGVVNDQFGWSVGISGDTAVVGARLDDTYTGSAYVFVRNGVTWSQQQKLRELTGDLFGWSVTITGDTIAVGSPGDDIGANISQGAVYVYTRSGLMWSLQQRLFASTPGFMAAFGRAVALSGETLAVGADLDDIGGNLYQGAAYLFTRSGTIWSQEQKLTAIDGAAVDLFGGKVALSGDKVVVGAWLADIDAQSDQGAAYAFTRSDSTWGSQQKLAASDGAANDQFGSSVAISENTIAVGAWLDDIGQEVDQGSVYVADCWLPDQIFLFLPLVNK